MSIDEVISAAYRYGSSRRFESEERSDKRMSTLRTAIVQHGAEAVAREREECAKVCDALNFVDTGTSPIGTRASNRHCAAAIRARGTT